MTYKILLPRSKKNTNNFNFSYLYIKSYQYFFISNGVIYMTYTILLTLSKKNTNNFNFNYLCIKSYQYFLYQINIIILIIKYTFIINLFGYINFDIFFYKTSQTLENLTILKSRIVSAKSFFGMQYTLFYA